MDDKQIIQISDYLIISDDVSYTGHINKLSDIVRPEQFALWLINMRDTANLNLMI